MNGFLYGTTAMGFVVSSLFFIRSWRRTRETLFLLFAVAFLVEAASRTALAINADPLEARPMFYLPRLFAYLLIIAGIVSKNLPSKRSR